MGSAYAHASGVATALFFGLPVVGLGWFLWLRARMRQLGVPAPPVLPLFLAFVSYGTLLEFVVTFLGQLPWSGMHELGALGSVVLLSWALPFYGFTLRDADATSGYHRLTSRLLRWYPAALVLLALGFVVLMAWSFND